MPLQGVLKLVSESSPLKTHKPPTIDQGSTHIEPLTSLRLAQPPPAVSARLRLAHIIVNSLKLGCLIPAVSFTVSVSIERPGPGGGSKLMLKRLRRMNRLGY